MNEMNYSQLKEKSFEFIRNLDLNDFKINNCFNYEYYASLTSFKVLKSKEIEIQNYLSELKTFALNPKVQPLFKSYRILSNLMELTSSGFAWEIQERQIRADIKTYLEEIDFYLVLDQIHRAFPIPSFFKEELMKIQNRSPKSIQFSKNKWLRNTVLNSYIHQLGLFPLTQYWKDYEYFSFQVFSNHKNEFNKPNFLILIVSIWIEIRHYTLILEKISDFRKLHPDTLISIDIAALAFSDEVFEQFVFKNQDNLLEVQLKEIELTSQLNNAHQQYISRRIKNNEI